MSTNIQVILLEQIHGVGKLGQIVKVARGFARNYLLPRGKALNASKENMAKFEAERAAREATMATAKAAAEKEAAKFENLTIALQRQASETGMLFGSVKGRDIAAALAEKGLTVEVSAIEIGNPIKNVGDHSVKVVLHPEVSVKLAVTVARQSQGMLEA
ncbi:MAG: 50S ribosomal protein L9 [Alphaproteobacteria bacterium]